MARAQDKDEARNEVLDLIATTEARPPRQIDDTIPKELERICLKALSKRASERYSTGKDMAEDLREFLKAAGGTVSPAAPAVPMATPPGSTQEADAGPINVQAIRLRSASRSRSSPRGCDPSMSMTPTSSWNCFPDLGTGMVCPTASDSGRPGSRQPTPTMTFRVGLDLRALGLREVVAGQGGVSAPARRNMSLPVYIEATPEETEARLLKGLRKACPELSPRLGLVDSLAAIRRGRVHSGPARRCCGPGSVRAMAPCEAR